MKVGDAPCNSVKVYTVRRSSGESGEVWKLSKQSREIYKLRESVGGTCDILLTRAGKPREVFQLFFLFIIWISKEGYWGSVFQPAFICPKNINHQFENKLSTYSIKRLHPAHLMSELHFWAQSIGPSLSAPRYPGTLFPRGRKPLNTPQPDPKI